MIVVDSWSDLPGTRHAFFTRDGGVSAGLYESCNCSFGSGDDPGNVAANRATAMAALDLAPEALATARQVHGTRVVHVEHPWPRDEAPQADGLVTRTPGVAVGILTADCAPVLFADSECGVIGAAHAGWRGALAGIVEATVNAMCALGARREAIVAAVGPCIGHESYEVGPEFPRPFLAEDPAGGALFAPSPREGHFLFDLRGYVARRLAALGLAPVSSTPIDTFTEESHFFSYRRATLRGERDYGRCLSAVALVG